MATAARSPDHRLMTAEELLALPDDVHAELVDGVLVVMSPASGPHGSIATRLLGVLYAWVQERGAGELFDSSTGFLLRRHPDTVRSPDVAFVRAERLPGGVQPGFVPLAPDLAVEILSPSNSAAEMNHKLADYFRHGTRLVWVVDPDARTVTTYAAGAVPRRLGGDDPLEGGDVLPGLAVPVAALFAGLAPRG